MYLATVDQNIVYSIPDANELLKEDGVIEVAKFLIPSDSARQKKFKENSQSMHPDSKDPYLSFDDGSKTKKILLYAPIYLSMQDKNSS